mmetsp:Transcript_52157/g.124278  ORF Transcript_52157/g.124278 Transcript_52157/m.124278 type:complete len:422 (-) Transcript_52157:181-1446(-)|eukprot:CAMPEP_0178418452 /NCGR_PEP_ID=MMETSP0689_2-20121128/25094_1 /TAXON_ID=160604 /ORGANISM="Amphidinium massartii, Strain CS-259" /LENGTH=421 /DNA_ID=CAMNT_0020039843 /DNA_START=63 /DNA_END=1328 /DNA_ORIENTATION=+
MVFGLKLGLAKKAPTDTPLSIGDNGHAREKSSGKSTGGNSKGGLTVNEFVARTKRCREKGLEPTKPELIAYARYLGIDPITDGDLMWIAEEALNAPLPAEWTEHHDNADRIFYYNVQSHQSSWTHPLEQLHRDTYKNIVHFRSGSLSKEEQQAELESLRKQCEETERDTHKELQAWAEHVDEQGQKFYYNHDQQRSVWTDPRPARCHTLYLQMKALRVLGKHMGQSTSVRGPEPLASVDGSHKLGHRHRDHGDRDRDRAEKGGHPLGGHHRDHTEGASGAGGGSIEESPGLDSEDELEDAPREHKRKRKKRREGKNHSDNERERHGGLESLGDPGDLKKPPSLMGEFKKPAGASVVEEARSQLGLMNSHHHHRHGGHLPHIGDARLPSPPGMRGVAGDDGLPTAGRAKVRAGIRLEPLQVE